MTEIKGYTLLEEEILKDLDGKGAVYAHDRTGARAVVLSNEDTELSMTLAFKTPPQDNSGLTHIIEHSVFCGSEKYPLKDPFAELMKGSMYTYLNAVTYGDMTVFPVAGRGRDDFDNLMDVYLDAVFNPVFLRNKAVFMQEGHHFNDDGGTGGVVLGEMRGLADDPDFLLNKCLKESLYPDSQYRFVSGGMPEDILRLSYEETCSYYRAHYHPSNCIVILYGKMNFEEKLRYIGEKYFDRYEKIVSDNSMKLQKPFESPHGAVCTYPLPDGNMDKKTYFAYAAVTGGDHDGLTSLTMQILNYVLCMAPGAYLHEEFMKEGVGEDFDILMDDQMRQPYYGFLCSYCHENEKDKFVSIIENTLRDLVKNGIDKDMLRAAVKTAEFNYREKDFGGTPKGIVYADMLLEKMIFDEERPLERLNYCDVIEKMKGLIETGYFEKFIKEKILDNPHKAVITMKPAAKNDDFEQMADMLFHMGNRADIALFNEYNMHEDSESDRAKIPVIVSDDLEKDKNYVPTEKYEVHGVPMLFQNRKTNGIGYLNLAFDMNILSENELHYVRLLVELLGVVDTVEHSYSELSEITDSNTGGIYNFVTVVDSETEKGTVRPLMVQRTAFLYDEADMAVKLNVEILRHSVFDDEKYIGELLLQLKSVYTGSMTSAPGAVAADIGKSMCSMAGSVYERVQGYDFYLFLCGLIDAYEKDSREILSKLKGVLDKLTHTDNMTIMYVGEKSSFDGVMEYIGKLVEKLRAGDKDVKFREIMGYQPLSAANMAYVVPAQVNNVVWCGTIGPMAMNQRGHMLVLEHMLNCGYLWQKVRAEGGAYGCSAEFSYNGTILFASVSDPHIERTLRLFQDIASYISHVTISEREMKQYIVGTMNELDMPMTPEAEGMAAMNLELAGMTHENVLAIRRQITETTQDDIKDLAPYFYEMRRNAHVIVTGSSTDIEKNKALFDDVRMLLQGGKNDNPNT